jgi:hypothetical protein
MKILELQRNAIIKKVPDEKILSNTITIFFVKYKSPGT